MHVRARLGRVVREPHLDVAGCVTGAVHRPQTDDGRRVLVEDDGPVEPLPVHGDPLAVGRQLAQVRLHDAAPNRRDLRRRR